MKRRRKIRDLQDEAASTISKKPKTSKVKKVKRYQRGSLIKAMYDYFDKVGVDDSKYEVAEKLAKSIKPDTAFNKYHFSWYRNDFKNRRDLP